MQLIKDSWVAVIEEAQRNHTHTLVDKNEDVPFENKDLRNLWNEAVQW